MATEPGAVSALVTETPLYKSLGSQKQQSTNQDPLSNQNLGANNRRHCESLKISIQGKEERHKSLTKDFFSALTIKIWRWMRDEKLWGIVKGIPSKPDEKELYITLQMNGSPAGTYHIMLLIYVQIRNAWEWQNEYRQWTHKGSTKSDPVWVRAACDSYLSFPYTSAMIWYPTCAVKKASLNLIYVQPLFHTNGFIFFLREKKKKSISPM